MLSFFLFSKHYGEWVRWRQLMWPLIAANDCISRQIRLHSSHPIISDGHASDYRRSSADEAPGCVCLTESLDKSGDRAENVALLTGMRDKFSQKAHGRRRSANVI